MSISIKEWRIDIFDSDTISQIPATTPVTSSLTSDDSFVSKVIEVVKINLDKDKYYMDSELRKIKSSYPSQIIPSEVVYKLVEQVKNTKDFSEHFSVIYHHLIDNFQINNEDISEFNEQFRFEYAKINMQKECKYLCTNMRKYRIKNEKDRIELAKIALKNNSFILCRCFKNFEIESESARLEIAKLAAQEQGGGGIAEYIRNYHIKNEDDRIEIAKLVAQNDGFALSDNIENFEIESESARCAIAMLVAEKEGMGVSQNIRNYHIKDEEDRIKIAELAVRESPIGVSYFLKNYDINPKNQKVRFALAKLAVGHSNRGQFVSKYIQNYGIKDEKQRFELAKLAAQHYPDHFSKSFRNFDIKEELARLELAYIAMRQNPEETIQYLSNYDLSIKNTVKLFARTLHLLPTSEKNMGFFFSKNTIAKQFPALRFFGLIDDFNISQFLLDFWEEENIAYDTVAKPLAEYAKLAQEKDPTIKGVKQRWLLLYCCVLDFARESKPLLNQFITLLNELEKEKNTRIKEQKMQWLAHMILGCRVYNVERPVLLDRWPLLMELLELRDPALRASLNPHFVDMLASPESFQASKEKTVEFASLILAHYFKKITPYIDSATHKSISFQERVKTVLSRKYFKDKEKSKSLLRGLDILVQTVWLTEAEKMNILRNCLFNLDKEITEKQCRKLLQLVQIVALLIEYGMYERLIGITNTQELEAQLQEVLSIILDLEVSDCNDKLLMTFGLWRQLTAFFTYIGKIKTLPPDQRVLVLPVLKRFAESVLNQTFFTTRYAIENSEHMQKLYIEAPELLEAWKKRWVFAQDNYVVVDTDDPCDLFLAGTEIGTCLRVDGDPDHSKALMAYLLDGKIRMMAIKNHNGVILARCMLRLLWDESTKKFTLYQEKIYSDFYKPEQVGILNEACLARAKQLGTSLFLIQLPPVLKNTFTLKAFKGPVPFEYVDGLQALIRADAGYEIDKCSCVYPHERITT